MLWLLSQQHIYKGVFVYRSTLTSSSKKSSVRFDTFASPFQPITPRAAVVGSPARSEKTPRLVTTGVTNSDVAPCIFSTAHIPVSSVACDWLSLTTFDTEAFNWLCNALAPRLMPNGKHRKVMQYDGAGGDGWFFGRGQQTTKTHYLIHLTGSVAQLALDYLLCFDESALMLGRFKCTRFDVQYTRPGVPERRLAEIGFALEAAEWSRHKGRRPSVEMFVNKDKLDTLYIGSRKESVRMQRIYIKDVGAERCTRWEIEYKEELSKKLWLLVLESGSTELLPGVLMGEIAQVPFAPLEPAQKEFDTTVSHDTIPLPDSAVPVVSLWLAEFAQLIGVEPMRLTLVRDDSDVLKTLAWLHSSVVPCVQRLQRNDDVKIQAFVREFLLFALASADNDYVPPSRPALGAEFWLPQLYTVSR